MTDLLIRDPNDTGEIPTDPGMRTKNLAPYAAGLAPVLRRPDATGELPAITAFRPGPTGPDTPPGPDPLPPPPPPTPRVDDRPLSAGEEVVWTSAPVDQAPYQGRHRAKPRWYGPLVEAVAVGWARVRRSM